MNQPTYHHSLTSRRCDICERFCQMVYNTFDIENAWQELRLYCCDCYSRLCRQETLQGISNGPPLTYLDQDNLSLECLEQRHAPTACLPVPYSNDLSPFHDANYENNENDNSDFEQEIPTTSRRAQGDFSYTKGLTDSILSLGRQCGVQLPKDGIFSKRQPREKEYLSKKGVLQNVLNWVILSKEEHKKMEKKIENLLEEKRLICEQIEKNEEIHELRRKVHEIQESMSHT